MTREEEIKELADFLKWDCLNKPNDYCEDSECYMCRATALVDAGWHKQIEAEWVMKNAPVECYECSNCGAELPFGLLARYTPYCCKCGAKMTIEGEII